MALVRLRYIWTDQDRHGNTRRYVKQPGKSKIRLREEPGTAAFLAEYQRAIDGLATVAAPARIVPGSVLSACIGYYSSAIFRALSPGTQAARRNILDRACKTIGGLPIAGIAPRNIQCWIDGKSKTPEAANNLLKALRGLFRHAMKAELVTADPSEKIGKIKTKTEGHHTWTLTEARQFEAHHPVGTTPRLAFALLLYTGQRRSDVVKMGPQHLEDGTIRVRQMKTGKTLYLTIRPALAEIIAASKTGGLSFLVTEQGRPFSAKGFGMRFRAWCNAAGLPKHCVAHGLRKAGATFAANLGASEHTLMATFGWDNAEQAMIYTAKADQKRLAKEGARLIELGMKTEQENTHRQNGECVKPETAMKSKRA